jgi:hypothetical protein
MQARYGIKLNSSILSIPDEQLPPKVTVFPSPIQNGKLSQAEDEVLCCLK